MQKNKSTMAKGIGLGMAVGGMVGLVGSSMMSRPAKRQTKKNVTKAMHTVGQMIDNVSNLVSGH